MEQLIDEKRILWPASATGRPREKTFFAEMPERTNISTIINLPIFTRNGTDSFERILGHENLRFQSLQN